MVELFRGAFCEFLASFVLSNSLASVQLVLFVFPFLVSLKFSLVTFIGPMFCSVRGVVFCWVGFRLS